MEAAESINLNPKGLATSEAIEFLRALVDELGQLKKSSDWAEFEYQLERRRAKYVANIGSVPQCDRLGVTASTHIFIDLAKQGWHLGTKDCEIVGVRPTNDVEGEERAFKRAQLVASRNEQLRKASARRFILKMEQDRIGGLGRNSIFSLMRDGRELAKTLERINHSRDEDIGACIDPYIQFVESGVRCAETGFFLQDIWRYFRHTWSNPYESIPGRSMLFLVRDRAAENHPVMGLGAISSATVQLDARDRFIGWHGETFLELCESNPSSEIADWIIDVLDKGIGSIYQLDLIEDGLLPPYLDAVVSDERIEVLRKEGVRARDEHHRRGVSSHNKSNVPPSSTSDEEWEAYARSYLFRAKRAAELAAILEVRNVILQAFENHVGVDRLAVLLKSVAGRNAFLKIVRMARSITVGTEIADLTVCGAIPPYNEIIGGKLIAMLAASPQVINEYARRYRDVPSVIASSVAGRKVVRPANLVFLGTTSLYGERPNQYDRASYPASLACGTATEAIRYKFLVGKSSRTEGVGTFQFGRETKKSIEQFLTSLGNGRRVNNVFGEGTNPKLRALRDGLERLGFDSNVLLEHGLQKVVYGVSFASNVGRYLLRLDQKPNYYFSLEDDGESSKRIFQFWFDRWVKKRIARSDVLDRIKRHTLIRPIRHGARVLLPDDEASQLSFD